MMRCWSQNPDFRPPFEKLRQRMENYIEEKVWFVIILDYKLSPPPPPPHDVQAHPKPPYEWRTFSL